MLARRTRGLASVTALAILLAACGSSPSDSSANAAPYDVMGTLQWPRPEDQHALILKANMPAAADPAAPTVRWHAHLDVFLNGAPVLIPADLGVDELDQTMAPLHTRDDSGVLYVEARDTSPLTLGQLFTLWDVRLDANCVADYCSPETPIATYVNGEEYAGNPAELVLKNLQQISVVVGTAPPSIPEAYGDL